MTIHPAVHAFGPSADAYERGRPDYPAAAIDHIAHTFDITPESTVVDLAAGTGKFTRQLLSLSAHIVAIEPIAGMRDRLAAQLPDIDTREGTAEDMPLKDASVDVVTVAQAFHWFGHAGALREIHRVLRPGGGLALIWNQRDTEQPVQRAITDLVERHRRDEPTHRGGRWRQAFENSELFTPPVEWQVRHKQEMDAERLVDRIVSISFIAALPETDRARIREEALELARGMPERFALRYVTSVFTSTSR